MQFLDIEASAEPLSHDEQSQREFSFDEEQLSGDYQGREATPIPSTAFSQGSSILGEGMEWDSQSGEESNAQAQEGYIGDLVDEEVAGILHRSSSVAEQGRPARSATVRWQGKQFALTYPQTGDIPREEFDRAFKLKYGSTLVAFLSAREPHKDGGWHIHCYAKFEYKLRFSDPRYFDITVGLKELHPNIQTVRSSAAWQKYISKGGDVGRSGVAGYDPGAYKPGKKKSAYLDLVWESQFLAGTDGREISYPITIPGTVATIIAPTATVKKRSYWIVAPPNAGKSWWANEQFDGQRVFMRADALHPYEDYLDQELIIYDDQKGVSFSEFANVLNVYSLQCHVFGAVRYVSKYWKKKQARSILFLTNSTLEDYFKRQHPLSPATADEEINAMRARFIEITNFRYRGLATPAQAAEPAAAIAAPATPPLLPVVIF